MGPPGSVVEPRLRPPTPTAALDRGGTCRLAVGTEAAHYVGRRPASRRRPPPPHRTRRPSTWRTSPGTATSSPGTTPAGGDPDRAGRRPGPAVVDVHGGAWASQDRTLGVRYCVAAARAGFTVVSIRLPRRPHGAAPRRVRRRRRRGGLGARHARARDVGHRSRAGRADGQLQRRPPGAARCAHRGAGAVRGRVLAAGRPPRPLPLRPGARSASRFPRASPSTRTGWSAPPSRTSRPRRRWPRRRSRRRVTGPGGAPAGGVARARRRRPQRPPPDDRRARGATAPPAVTWS